MGFVRKNPESRRALVGALDSPIQGSPGLPLAASSAQTPSLLLFVTMESHRLQDMGLGEARTPKLDLLQGGCDNTRLSFETPLAFRDGLMSHAAL